MASAERRPGLAECGAARAMHGRNGKAMRCLATVAHGSAARCDGAARSCSARRRQGVASSCSAIERRKEVGDAEEDV